MPQLCRVLTPALVLCAVLATEARGQRLLEVDGIELRGESQRVLSGGGTCNVLESDTAFEAKKANHGAPMDIWRLDFSVRNGSGRWLDHLVARFHIDSEWPDCTNWDGPDATEFAEFIEWADSIGVIQESGRNVVAPGQTLTDTTFFIVLRGDPEPRFANWSMDFDFAAAPPTADSGSPTAAVAAGAVAQQPAPPATAEQETVFWQSIMDSTNTAMFEAYLAQFPNGVFRALAEARLAELRAPAGASPTVDRQPTGVVAGSDALLRSGEVFRDCDGCPEMVVIPAGTFRMGCVSGRGCESDERPLHVVTISRPFALSTYEVTFEEYDRFTAATGRAQADDEGWGRGRRPVINVSWNDAQEYVAWLSSETGARYRLPSEAEWEYAARAGTTTTYSWGNAIGDNRANCDGCGSQWDDSMTAPVGSFAPNVWGFARHARQRVGTGAGLLELELSGCADGRLAWESGTCEWPVMRGGSWTNLPIRLRATARLWDGGDGVLCHWVPGGPSARVKVSPGKAGGFNCEPLKAACGRGRYAAT